METVLAWPKNSKTEPDPARVAAELGLGLRRVRSLLYGDPVVVGDEELARLRAAFIRHLDAEAARLEARSAAARERLRRERGEP
jgi:hypothetical protein